MTELKSRISGFTTDYASGKQMLTLELSTDFRPYIDELKEKDLTVCLKRYRNKRSHDANAFFWATVGDISAKLQIPPIDIYREMIRDVGDNYVIVPVKLSEVDRWIRNWSDKGLGWVCESIGASKLPGYENCICYYGSSTYDTAQMARLIDLVVEEAKAQGIQPRLTAAERQAALELWGEDCAEHTSEQ